MITKHTRLILLTFLCILLLPTVSTSHAAVKASTKYMTMLWVTTGSAETYSGMSWEFKAPLNSTNNLQWFTAAIYPGYEVHLYKFDQNFRYLNAYNMSAADWVAHREQYCLAKFSLAPEGMAEVNSRLLADAFLSFLQTMMQDTPAQHYGLFYSGHGSEKALFEGQIGQEDSEALLENITESIGRKLDVLDVGTNCTMANSNNLAVFYPYFDYIVATDQNCCLGRLDDYTPEKRLQTWPEYQYGLIVGPSVSIKESLLRRLDVDRLLYEYNRNTATLQQAKQSVSLFETSGWEGFIDSIAGEIESLPFLSRDALIWVRSLNRVDIEQKFLDVRVGYRSNKDMFTWDVDSNGLWLSSLESLQKDFSIPQLQWTGDARPPVIVMRRGINRTFHWDVKTKNGFRNAISFESETLPPGVDVNFSPVELLPPGVVRFTVNASETAALGEARLGFNAASAGFSKYYLLELYVTDQATFLPSITR